jgi:hypothetical protein
MLNDRDDPILDVCLEEVLGGQQPPDLSARILAAWQGAPSGLRENGTPALAADALRPIPVKRVVIPAAQPAALRAPAGSSFARSAWLPLSLAASLLLAVGGFWFVRQRTAGPVAAERQQVQKQSDPAAKQGNPEKSDDSQPRRHAVAEQSPATMKGMPESTDRRQVVQDKSASARNAVVRREQSTQAEPAHGGKMQPHDQEADAPRSPAGESVASASRLTDLPTSAVSDREMIALIDRALRARWQEANVRPSPAATDAEWCRRVFLDLIGRGR